MSRTKLFIILVLIVAISVCVVLFFGYPSLQKNTHEILLTESGFHPVMSIVDRGDTVVFKNKTDQQFWPASNLHPSHMEYPSLDSKQPIDSEGTWAFVFSETGVYNVHDHINPRFTATIIVGNTIAVEDNKEIVFASCLHMSELRNKITCWNDYILNELEVHGIDHTFKIFTEIYKTDPDFVSFGCHGSVHIIGEAAYDLYKTNQDFSFTADTAVCGYGFFHGFLEKLLHDDPDLQNAKKFCTDLADEFGTNLSGIRTNCFHGIGHGMVEEEPLAEYYWGNIDALLGPALSTCSSISDDPEEVRECIDGAFNGLSRFMVYGKYGFTYNDEQPIVWCKRFEETAVYYESCIFETSQHFSERVLGYDISKIFPHLDGLTLDLQKVVVAIAVGGMLQRDVVREDNSDYFERCTVFANQDLQESCIGGVVNGFFSNGEPGNEAEKAIQFCDSDAASVEQREYCKKVLQRYLNTYSQG